jgi:antitoxin CcdA
MNTYKNRKPSNLSLDLRLIEEARALEINLSRAAENGIRNAVAAEKAIRWKLENAEALQDANRWVKENGLPLAKHRMF